MDMPPPKMLVKLIWIVFGISYFVARQYKAPDWLRLTLFGLFCMAAGAVFALAIWPPPN
jgi:hypothetical protein